MMHGHLLHMMRAMQIDLAITSIFYIAKYPYLLRNMLVKRQKLWSAVQTPIACTRALTNETKTSQ